MIGQDGGLPGLRIGPGEWEYQEEGRGHVRAVLGGSATGLWGVREETGGGVSLREAGDLDAVYLSRTPDLREDRRRPPWWHGGPESIGKVDATEQSKGI